MNRHTNPQQPKVSIIIVTYNQRDTVGRAIESVLTQDFDGEYEVVVADDCSTDGTRDICLEYARKHPGLVRVIANEHNLGLVRNYFNALEACRGEYITDCAGDDYWSDDTVLRRNTAILESNPEVNVVFSDFIIHNPSTGSRTRAYSLDKYSKWSRPVIQPEEMLLGVLGHVDSLPYMLSSALYRKADITSALSERKDMVCNPDFGCEDLPVMAALAARGAAAYSPVVALTYNVGGESVSNYSDKAKRIEFQLRTLRATRILAGYYRVELPSLSTMFHKSARYMLGLSLESGNRSIAADVISELAQWNLPLTFSEKLYKALLSNPLTTTLGKAAKKL